MSVNRKNNTKHSTLEAANKKGIKLWFWLMIAGPAIFLLLYWLYSKPETVAHEVKQPIPQSFLKIGQGASINDNILVVGPDKKIYFTRTLQLGNNTVAAESGHTFLVVPVGLSQSAAEIQRDYWWALDGEGTRYPLLKTTVSNPVNNDNNKQTPPAGKAKTIHQIYKIANENTNFYIVFSKSDKKIVWKVK